MMSHTQPVRLHWMIRSKVYASYITCNKISAYINKINTRIQNEQHLGFVISPVWSEKGEKEKTLTVVEVGDFVLGPHCRWNSYAERKLPEQFSGTSPAGELYRLAVGDLLWNEQWTYMYNNLCNSEKKK